LAHAGEPAKLIQRVRDIQGEVATLRGLEFQVDVTVDVETPTQMREHMVQEIEQQLDEQTRLGLNLTWRTLGLVPKDFDVAVAYADILEQHVGGYFDVKRERLVLVQRATASGGPNPMQDMVTAHELVHALQDQNFDLWSLTQRELNNDDVGAALQALVEGDASYAMLYRLPVPLDPDQMGGALGASPRVLREPLVFPYTQGLVFAQRVKLSGDGWTALDRAFAAPPLSTEQVLHPDKYVGDNPDWPTMLDGKDPDRLLGPDWTLISQDTFGELGMRVVLREHLGTTVRPGDAVPGEGWDGDRLWLWQRNSDEAPAMLWVSTWDDETSAANHRRAMDRVVQRLYPHASWSDSPGLEGRKGREGKFEHGARRRGRDVVVTLNVPHSRARRLRRYARSLKHREVRDLNDVAAEPAEGRDAHED
jgi:hypothetical protein